MRLRTRLALSVVAAALPLAGASVWARRDLEQRRVAQVLREFAVTRMESGGRERCEADPEHFPPRPGPGGGPRGMDVPPPPPPPPELGGDVERPRRPPAPGPDDGTRFWAYGADLVSRNRDAPPVAEPLAAEIRGGADVALQRVADGEGSAWEALVRMPWSEGPGAFVLVRRRAPDADGEALAGLLTGVVVAGGVLVAVLFASGSVVRRIRRLESDVRRTAAVRYEQPVEVRGGDEVADLARAFNDAAAAVRAHLADVVRREETLRAFVANTTHDVMTPLTVLQGHLDALRHAVPPGDTDAAEALRDALREVDYTTSLVANLAAAAKLEAGPDAVLRRPVDLAALVERVAARHRPVARAQGVELNHAVPEERVVAEGDVTLLEQALGNVVQNAIRYNRAGGHVALVLRAPASGRFEIRVADDGVGVAAADLPRLTERGFRGTSARTRPSTGTGLGLDITRGVCDLHHIELSFEPGDPTGLVVTLRGERSTSA